MNPAEAMTLLSAIADADPMFKRPATSEEAALMSTRWARILEPVPLGFAAGYVERHYRKPDAWTVRTGEVFAAWRAHATRGEAEEAKAERDSLLTSEDAINLGRAPDWFVEAERAARDAAGWEAVYAISNPRARRQAVMDARQRAADAVEQVKAAHHTIPSPLGFVGAVEKRERACGVRLCACEHVHCRGGMLDGDQVAIRGGRVYVESVRCPLCFDAAKMVGESRPAPKGSRARHGGRL